MDFDYHFGNQYFKYYGDLGIKATEYEIMAPEQSQGEQPGKNT